MSLRPQRRAKNILANGATILIYTCEMAPSTTKDGGFPVGVSLAQENDALKGL